MIYYIYKSDLAKSRGYPEIAYSYRDHRRERLVRVYDADYIIEFKEKEVIYHKRRNNNQLSGEELIILKLKARPF